MNYVSLSVFGCAEFLIQSKPIESRLLIIHDWSAQKHFLWSMHFWGILKKKNLLRKVDELRKFVSLWLCWAPDPKQTYGEPFINHPWLKCSKTPGYFFDQCIFGEYWKRKICCERLMNYVSSSTFGCAEFLIQSKPMESRLLTIHDWSAQKHFLWSLHF